MLKKSKKNESKKVIVGDQPMSKQEVKDLAEKINSTAKKMVDVDGDVGPGTPFPSEKLNVNSTEESIDKETQDGVNEGMRKSIEIIDDMKTKFPYFRERIDYIMKIISLTGIQMEIATQVKTFNPIEHALVNLTMAKGSLGELMKHLIPAVELIGLRIHDMSKEKPEGTYPYIKGDYVDVLHSTIKSYFDGRDNAEVINFSDDQIKLIEMYKNTNPYSYPKQSGKDVEPVANQSNIDSLNIPLPEGKYKNSRGLGVVHASQLNNVQKVDWIKEILSDLIDEFVSYKFNTILKHRVRLYSKNENVDTLLLAIINLQATYNSLIDAKNLFGYTFQYVR